MVATILFISANPVRTAALELDEEYRAIDDERARAAQGKAFDLRPALAARTDDLRHKLAEESPAVVHFGGHTLTEGHAAEGHRDFTAPGASTATPARGELLLLDAAGQPKPVPIEPLAELFSLAGQPVRCVVLNACNTLAQADAIAAHLDGAVIGTTEPIPDAAAISFSKGFYGSLCAGGSVADAFAAGRNNVALESTGDPATYVLRHRDGVDPAQIQPAGPPPAPARAPLPLPALPAVRVDRPDAEQQLERELATKYGRLVTVQARDGAGKTTLVTRVLGKDGAPRVGYVALPEDLQAHALLEGVSSLADAAGDDGGGSPAERMARLLPRIGDGVLFVNQLHRAVDGRTGKLQSEVREALRAYLAYDAPTFRIVAASNVNPPDLEEPWALGRRAPVPFGVLPEPEMIELLRRLLEAHSPRALADAGAVARLPDAARRLGGLPVAAARLADYMALHPDTSLDRVLDEPRATALLDDLVAAAFTASTPEQQLVLQALAVFGCPVPPAAVDAVLRRGDAASSKEQLSALVTRGIVSFTGDRYALSELDQRHALRTIDGFGAAPEKGKPTAFRALCRSAAEWFYGQAPDCTADTLDLWIAQYRMYRACGEADDAAGVLITLGPPLVFAGHYFDAASLAEDILGVGIGIPEWEVMLLSTAGCARRELGEPAAALAHLERADARIAAGVRIRAEDRWRITEALIACRIDLGRVDEALHTSEQELAATTDPDVRRGCLSHQAYCHYLRGEIDQAIARATEARDLDQADDERRKGAILDTLAEALILAGRYDDALAGARDGAKIGRSLGDPMVISVTRVTMATVYLLQGQLASARGAAEAALGPAPPRTGGVIDWDRLRFYPTNDAEAAAVLGAIALRQGNLAEATLALRAAARKAAAILQDNRADTSALATSILARLGLLLAADLGGPASDVGTDPIDLSADHEELARKSRGAVLWLGKLLGALAPADKSGNFGRACKEVTGEAPA